MRLYRDQLGIRLAGTLVGAGFLFIGWYALFGGEGVAPLLRERAQGFGIAAVIAGLVAMPTSWLVKRLDNIWCAPPRRGWFRAPRRD